MGLNTDYAAVGMSPRPAAQHHDIIRNLVIQLDGLGIFARPEYCIDANDLNSQISDVLIYDDQTDRYPATIIKITTDLNFANDCQKVEQLMKQYPKVTEGFVYDYERDLWQCFGKDIESRLPSFSENFKVHFPDYF